MSLNPLGRRSGVTPVTALKQLIFLFLADGEAGSFPSTNTLGRNRGPRPSNGTLYHRSALMELGPLGARSTADRSFFITSLFRAGGLGTTACLFATTVYWETPLGTPKRKGGYY